MSDSQPELIASVFEGLEKLGDFSWMLQQPGYEQALFIFNDNEECFVAHMEDPNDGLGCQPGGGNAIIRPYRCQDPPRAAGVPTGADGNGYFELSDHARDLIDQSVAHIHKLLSQHDYDRIFFSGDGEGGLGTGIFNVAEPVKQYIVEQLKRLV